MFSPRSTCLLGPLPRVVRCGPSPSQEYGFTLLVLVGVSSKFQLRLYFVAVAKFQPTCLSISVPISILSLSSIKFHVLGVTFPHKYIGTSPVPRISIHRYHTYRYRVFNKYCAFHKCCDFSPDSTSSAAAELVFDLPLCAHADTKGKQIEARVRNIS